jgi:hypothetical protein
VRTQGAAPSAVRNSYFQLKREYIRVSTEAIRFFDGGVAARFETLSLGDRPL